MKRPEKESRSYHHHGQCLLEKKPLIDMPVLGLAVAIDGKSLKIVLQVRHQASLVIS